MMKDGLETLAKPKPRCVVIPCVITPRNKVHVLLFLDVHLSLCVLVTKTLWVPSVSFLRDLAKMVVLDMVYADPRVRTRKSVVSVSVTRTTLEALAMFLDVIPRTKRLVPEMESACSVTLRLRTSVSVHMVT